MLCGGFGGGGVLIVFYVGCFLLCWFVLGVFMLMIMW